VIRALALASVLAACFSKPQEPAATSDGRPGPADGSGAGSDGPRPCQLASIDNFTQTPLGCMGGALASGGGLSLTPQAGSSTVCTFMNVDVHEAVVVYVAKFVHDGMTADTLFDLVVDGDAAGTNDDISIQLVYGYMITMKGGPNTIKSVSWTPTDPVWWKLEATGSNTVTGYFSPDGNNWQMLGSATTMHGTINPSWVDLSASGTGSQDALFMNLATCNP
jgi:hypothetical protein